MERQIAELQAAIAVFDADSDNADRFIKMVRRYTEIPELNATILNEYIEKIVVFEADKSSGRREQTVDFYFNFIGKVALPGQDDEAEPFDPEEHRKAQYRAYYYRNREKILATKAEQRAEEKAAKPAKSPEEFVAEEEARRERKRAYQSEYQRDWQRRRREEKAHKTA